MTAFTTSLAVKKSFQLFIFVETQKDRSRISFPKLNVNNIFACQIYIRRPSPVQIPSPSFPPIRVFPDMSHGSSCCWKEKPPLANFLSSAEPAAGVDFVPVNLNAFLCSNVY